jgi:hypothetical protein
MENEPLPIPEAEQANPEATPPGDPLDPSLAPPAEPAAPADATTIYGREIPPDNEHGDGVRNPPTRPCAGVRGNGLMNPRIFVKSEDWRDYNYADFGY